MLKVKKVEVVPRRDRFGIEHRLTLEGDAGELAEAFRRFSSARHFEAEGNRIELVFDQGTQFSFETPKPLEDYYDQRINEEWKAMVMETLGAEEPFRFYSFFDAEGAHLGTVGYKQDCENLLPVVVVYDKF